jgi:hypothetical protein
VEVATKKNTLMSERFKIFLLCGSIAVLFCFSFSTLFFLDIINVVDELGLWNPVYTYLHYGKMTYPAHYYFDGMFVHPPTRYLEVAWLMKFGMPAFFARNFSLFFIMLIIAYAIFRSSLDINWRLAFIFSVIWTFIYFIGFVINHNIRPDIPLAAAFIAGLLCLESGRQKKWNRSWLFVGSFLFTYACGLHYFAWPGLLGILAYFYASYKEQNERDKNSSWRSMILGCALFGVPYLFLFVLPYFSQIKDYIFAVQKDGGFFSGVLRHYDFYVFHLQFFNWKNISIASVIQSFYFIKAPVFIVAGLILLKPKNSRYFFLCALPLCFFVWFFSYAKSNGYYIIETFLLLFALLRALPKVFDLLLSFHYFKYYKNAATLSIVIVGLFFGLQPTNKYFDRLKIVNNYNILETDIARASARDIIGSDALVGGRIANWFIGGGQQWYDLIQDLIWNKDRPINQQQYISTFDAIVENNFMSYQSSNIAFGNPNNWYLKKLVNLKGFFFGNSSENVSFPIYTAKPINAIKGYIWNGNQLFRFDETSIGDKLFVTLSCKFVFDNLLAPNPLNIPNYLPMFLPQADELETNIALKFNNSPTRLQQAIVFSLWDKKDWQKRRADILNSCQLHELIPGNLTEINYHKFVDNLQKTDSVIQFDREIIKRKLFFKKPEINLGFASSLDLQQVKAFSKNKIIFHEGELWLAPKLRRLKNIASIPLPKIINNPKYVSIEASITGEEIDIAFLDKNGQLKNMHRLGSTMLVHYYDFFIPILENQDLESFVIRTTYGKNKTNIRIRSISIY